MRQGEAAGAIRALGAMSGTSLDGVDAAVLLTDGQRIHGFGPTGYRPYSDAERAVLRAALGRWPGEAGVAEAAAVVEAAHAELLAQFPQAELVGFHGQTLAHEPGGRGTHQAGSGQRLAEALGKPVVWDFRSADVGMGGQGAPLAPFYHFACAKWIGAEAPVAFLNLGGVGNLTWVDPAAEAPEAPGALLAFDTGPANAPMDDLMQARRGLPRDEGGALAATGRVDEALVARLLDHPYLYRMPPKSLDRMDFPELPASLAGLGDADALATAAAFAAACVAAGLSQMPAPPTRLLVTGGGRLNPVLMRMIAARVPCPVAPGEAAGLDGDMVEGQAFAHLAVRVVRGMPTSCPGTTGVAAAVGGGQFSDPGDARPRLGRA
jgi:anhydro-N-acetylmuramic acid kinase